MRYGLFLMEQILAILVFAVAAAICVQLFVSAHLISRDNGELNNALLVAQNGAEAFKAAQGDWQLTADLLDDEIEMSAGRQMIYIAYDENWQLSDDAHASYFMELKPAESAAPGLDQATISIREANAAENEAIYQLQVTAREAI
jgi:hypothetical protein